MMQRNRGLRTQRSHTSVGRKSSSVSCWWIITRLAGLAHHQLTLERTCALGVCGRQHNGSWRARKACFAVLGLQARISVLEGWGNHRLVVRAKEGLEGRWNLQGLECCTSSTACTARAAEVSQRVGEEVARAARTGFSPVDGKAGRANSA